MSDYYSLDEPVPVGVNLSGKSGSAGSSFYDHVESACGHDCQALGSLRALISVVGLAVVIVTVLQAMSVF